MTEPVTSSVPPAGPDFQGIAERHAAALTAAALAEKRAEAAERDLAAEREKATAAAAEVAAERESAKAEREKAAAEAVETKRKSAVTEAAAKANARDPKQVLALLHPDAVRMAANGEFEGITEAIAALAKESPWLFKVPSSADAGPVPKTKPMGDRPVKDMTPEEYKIAVKNLR